jgi:hypothetical protein
MWVSSNEPGSDDASLEITDDFLNITFCPLMLLVFSDNVDERLRNSKVLGVLSNKHSATAKACP